MKKLLLTSVFLIFSLVIQSQELPFGSAIDQCELQTGKIDEASGIASSTLNPGILWTHNDSGGKSRIFALNIYGEIVCELNLKDLDADDWEDICIGPGQKKDEFFIYIGEIGDNPEKKEVKRIIRVKEPLLSKSDKEIDTKNYDIFKFKYPDGKHDAEALMIDPIENEVYVITKRTPYANVYKVPLLKNSISTAEKVITLDIGEKATGSITSRVCASDISQDGSEILIKTYDSVYYCERNTNETIKESLSKELIALPYSMEPQGEAIAFSSDDTGYYTLSEESPFKIKQHLYFYPRKGIADIVNNHGEIIDLDVEIKNNSNNLIIKLDLDRNMNIDIKLYDISGNLIKKLKSRKIKKGKHKLEFDVSELSSGLFFIKVKTNGSFMTKKIILTN